MLTSIGKNIIISRLYDKNIKVNNKDLDNYIIDIDNFKSLNDMYDFIVSNYNKLIIG